CRWYRPRSMDVRAAGRRGAGAPPAEARLWMDVRAAGRRGAGAPPAEARLWMDVRAAGRRGAGAPPAEARFGKEGPHDGSRGPPLISSDGHLEVRPERWSTRMPAKYR